METRWLKRDYREAAAELKGKYPAPAHIDQTINQQTVVMAPDGSIPAVLLTQQIDPELYKPAYELWKTVDELPTNRATAVGSLSLPRQRKDGTLSERRVVPENVLKLLQKQGVRHGMLGYLDATPDQPCHKTPLSIKRPEMLDQNDLLIKRVDELYKQHMPSLHAIQRAEVEKGPRWQLANTAFTTIYIIKNLRSACHADHGNLPGVMSVLMPMGKFTGGELILARWRIAIAFKPGDLLLFDPQQLHGNLPFEGERLSAIFYCVRRIADCGR
ncbi:MAG TPA: hypothetical protein VNE63_00835 [Candidatus Acidoferrales bacterium]|nr:hypothetical protein [Candidatus Acidoferrales bacterium]